MESSNKRPVSGICPRADVSEAHAAMTRLDALDRRLVSEIAAVQELDADVALPHTCRRLALLSDTIDLRAVMALDLIGADAETDAFEAAALVTRYRLAICAAAASLAELLRLARRTA